MDEPTDKQKREFWGKYGWSKSYLKATPFVDPHLGHFHTDLPPIDLNNLSRYAIPKLIKEYHNWKSVLHDWVDGLTGDYEKDALSLYWLLAQTMV